ncbi:MAG: Nitrogen fixation protein VnfA [Syntrophaceae bacterium PtaB.Bin038]|nr:MAG: Nitrogen fixation protein VnfA [Syntrophaceae bacterium PtaB.Bin038]
MSRFNYEELAALHKIARILTQPGELRDHLEKTLDELSKRLGMERGMISILDQTTKEAWLEVARSVDIEGLDIRYKPGEGITGKVAQTGRPMAIANLGKENLFLDRTGARKNLDRSQLAFLCVPILYDGKVVGVLSADKLTHKVTDLEEEVAVLSAVAELIGKAVHGLGLEEENRRLRKMLTRTRAISTDIIGNSRPMQDVLSLISQVADSSTTVLINGETGTGKELVARAIHANSPRRDGPFIQVNCAAMPDTLVESELFGHEKGAFTGAIQRRRGLFEEAHGGTIFLDEIGELSQAAQAKVLRVLQEKQLQPVGSSRTVTVNVRVIAATNRNLEQDVAEGRFRADLFYRLNVFPIYMPALRERGSDIILLTDHFILKYAKMLGKRVKRISTPALDMLLAYHWPGNVRELENCIERAVILATGDSIESTHLPPSLQMKSKEAAKKERGKLETLVNAYERSLIIDALKDARGNQTRAAKLLATTKRIIQYKIAKYEIDPKRFKAKRLA